MPPPPWPRKGAGVGYLDGFWKSALGGEGGQGDPGKASLS